MLKRSLALFLLLPALIVQAQAPARPKLVVGVVVDQMRWDFLYRYSDRYGANGFKRLLREGFSCENAFIPYTPTYTAPGHASVYTGSVPALNGIIGNFWYDKSKGRNVYCTEDEAVSTVGSTSNAGKMSPRNMWASTIGDELRIAGNFRGKSIGIALKDRGAILPAGHAANGAYWFDNANGSWITSTYYGAQLPGWVAAENARKRPDQYLKRNWNTLYPITTYKQSTADDKPYESPLPGEDKLFLHRTDSLTNNKYESFRYTPYANTFTLDMAKAAIEGERLGKSAFTDFLAVSFSSTDYIGHAFGPNSVEIEDTYLRLDRDIADFLAYLDQKIGKGQYLLFLTADHGVAHVPGFAREAGLPAGSMDDAAIRKQLNDAVQGSLGIGNAIASVINYQVYLNDKSISDAKGDRGAVKQVIVRTLAAMPGIARAFDLEKLGQEPLPQVVKMMAGNGYNQKLSGDVQFLFQPNWFDWGGSTGTTHGALYPYDSHIPLVWFGWNIKPGKLYRNVYMTDIAVTIAAKLMVQMPNAAVGEAITEVVK
jgi:hypothetical protein